MFSLEASALEGLPSCRMFHQPKQGENSLESCREGVHVGRKEGRVRGNQKHNQASLPGTQDWVLNQALAQRS